MEEEAVHKTDEDDVEKEEGSDKEDKEEESGDEPKPLNSIPDGGDIEYQVSTCISDFIEIYLTFH